MNKEQAEAEIAKIMREAKKNGVSIQATVAGNVVPDPPSEQEIQDAIKRLSQIQKILVDGTAEGVALAKRFGIPFIPDPGSTLAFIPAGAVDPFAYEGEDGPRAYSGWISSSDRC